jgi:hypothetical protein
MTANKVEALGTVAGVLLLLGRGLGKNELLDFATRRTKLKANAIPWASVIALAEELHDGSGKDVLGVWQCLDIADAVASCCAPALPIAQDSNAASAQTETTIHLACFSHFVTGILLRYSPSSDASDAQNNKVKKQGRGKKQAKAHSSDEKRMSAKQCKKLANDFISSFNKLCPSHQICSVAALDEELDVCLKLALQVWNLCSRATAGTPEYSASANAFLSTLVAAVECSKDEASKAYWRYPRAATAMWTSLLQGQQQQTLGLLLTTLAANSSSNTHVLSSLSSVCSYLQSTLKKTIGLPANTTARCNPSDDTQLALAILREAGACQSAEAVLAIASPDVIARCISMSVVAVRKAALGCTVKQLSYLLSTVGVERATSNEPTLQRDQKLVLFPSTTSLPFKVPSENHSSDATLHAAEADCIMRHGQEALSQQPPLSTIIWLCRQQLSCLRGDKDATCRRQACTAVACHVPGLLQLLEDSDCGPGELLVAYFASLTVALRHSAQDASKTVRAEVFKTFRQLCSTTEKALTRVCGSTTGPLQVCGRLLSGSLCCICFVALQRVACIALSGIRNGTHLHQFLALFYLVAE